MTYRYSSLVRVSLVSRTYHCANEEDARVLAEELNNCHDVAQAYVCATANGYDVISHEEVER